jgi:hypothetical protein
MGRINRVVGGGGWRWSTCKVVHGLRRFNYRSLEIQGIQDVVRSVTVNA